MRKGMAAAGSAVFFALAPGVAAGLVPWWLTGWRVETPLPFWAPLRVVGVALLLGQPGLLLYAALVAAAMVLFAHGYEEPTLASQFGARYEAYRRAVPAWWPRRHPWEQADDERT